MEYHNILYLVCICVIIIQLNNFATFGDLRSWLLWPTPIYVCCLECIFKCNTIIDLFNSMVSFIGYMFRGK